MTLDETKETQDDTTSEDTKGIILEVFRRYYKRFKFYKELRDKSSFDDSKTVKRQEGIFSHPFKRYKLDPALFKAIRSKVCSRRAFAESAGWSIVYQGLLETIDKKKSVNESTRSLILRILSERGLRLQDVSGKSR